MKFKMPREMFKGTSGENWKTLLKGFRRLSKFCEFTPRPHGRKDCSLLTKGVIAHMYLTIIRRIFGILITQSHRYITRIFTSLYVSWMQLYTYYYAESAWMPVLSLLDHAWNAINRSMQISKSYLMAHVKISSSYLMADVKREAWQPQHFPDYSHRISDN